MTGQTPAVQSPVATFNPTTKDRDPSTGIERYSDVISTAYNERVVYLNGVVDDNMSVMIVAQLMELNRKDQKAPIQMIINSPGGSIMAGNAIVDAMRHITAPVHTVGMGICASMGSYILSMGEPGHRSVTPDCEVMVHQPLTGMSQSQQTNVQITADHIKQLRRHLQDRYMLRMGVLHEDFRGLINDLLERDNYLPALIAKKLRLIDNIIDPSNPLDKEGKPSDILSPERKAWKKAEFDFIMASQQRTLDDIKANNKVSDPDNYQKFKAVIHDIIAALEEADKKGRLRKEFAPAAAPEQDNSQSAQPGKARRERKRPDAGPPAPSAS